MSLASILYGLLFYLVRWRWPIHSVHCDRGDLLKGLMMVGAGWGLQRVDSSRLYHSIRGQSTLKLYVIYNVLEVADKLCCSFGLDILDSFFSQGEGINEEDEARPIIKVRPIPHFLLTIIYILVHSIVLFYQAITLNVAINSYSNALLTLLVSNQFVEIKSAVFKKFEKENLFQLSCADIIERFQLSLYLLIIGFRNLSEMRNSLDARFLLEGLLLPLSVVYISEIAVDWLKHAFITKFNHIAPEVYVRFANVLAKDFVEGGDGLADKSPFVSRRIGFSVFPLTCLLIRVLLQHLIASNISWSSLGKHLAGMYGIIFICKLILGINLAGYCKKRAIASSVTGASKRKATIPSSSSQIFDEHQHSAAGRKTPSAVAGLSHSGSLDTIDRYTMVKSSVP